MDVSYVSLIYQVPGFVVWIRPKTFYQTDLMPSLDSRELYLVFEGSITDSNTHIFEVGAGGGRMIKLAIPIAIATLFFILAFGALPAGAQPAEFVFDQEIFTYPAAFNLITGTFYNGSARSYTGTAAYSVTLALNNLPPGQTYLLYAWRTTGYSDTRFSVDNAEIATVTDTVTAGWLPVGRITVAPGVTPTLQIDRADVNGGNLVVDAIKFVWFAENSHVLYELPTTGDQVTYIREITAGDILIASGVWALAILFIFREIWAVARGRE